MSNTNLQRYKIIFIFAPNIQIIFNMKKLTIALASLLMLFALRMNAQTERILLFECFTNTSCGPCASQNPALDALINNNADRVAAIKYHMNWPGANDPMYLHNTGDNNARRSVYNVNSVPHTVVDGSRFADMPSYLSQNMVNNWLAIESSCEMRLSCDVDEAANTVTVHVMGRALNDLTGSLKLYVGVIEKEIHYNSAPGSNGERDFYSVMKKLLPTAGGTALGNVSAGDYFAYSFTWEMANVYDVNQIDAIAWIQNPDNKEVLQACKSSASMEPYYANEAALSGLTNLKGMNCSGVAEPVVTMINNGSQPLTTAVLEVLVNDEVVKTFDWSGNLGLFENAEIELGEIEFAVESNNNVTVRIASVNGVADEGPLNNEVATNVKGSPNNSQVQLKLTIRTDDNPGETTWKVTNLASGEVVQEGGPYDEVSHVYNEILEITADGCYDFTIYDAGGDGFAGSGVYGLKAGSQTLFSGKSFGYSESNEFSYEVFTGAEELDAPIVGVYPNPTTGMVTLTTDGQQKIAVYNLAGQCVYEGVCEGTLQLDLKPFGSGVYAIKAGDQVWRTVVK